MGIKEELEEAGIALLDEEGKNDVIALFNTKLNQLMTPQKTLVGLFKSFDNEYASAAPPLPGPLGVCA